MEDPRIEAVARAVCEERGEDPDEELRCFLIAGTAFEEGDPLPLWHEWLPEARAALAAADAAAWRPIEEVDQLTFGPRTGYVPVDLWVVHSKYGGRRCANSYWNGQSWLDFGGNPVEWNHTEDDGTLLTSRVTHFMPLPTPPEGGA